MTIITKPSIVTKNEAAQFTLNKTELSNHATVAANTYFQDTANWKEVIMKFTSTSGNQIEVLVFDATQSSPTANFLVSDKARNGFEIQSITIMDFDGGSLKVSQMDLNMSEFDVAVSGASAPVAALWDALSGSATTSGSGQLQRNDFTLGWDAGAWHTTPLSGDFTFSGIFNLPSGASGDTMLGYKTSLPVSGGAITNYITTSIYFHGSATVGSSYGGSPVIVNPSVGLSTAPSTNTFEIKRVSGVITAKVNGTTLFTETLAGNVYISSVMYANEGQSIVSSTLV